MKNKILSKNTSGAFLLERFLELDNWQLLEITDDISFDTQLSCPADDKNLSVICTLVAGRGLRRIRIGSCFSCGYTGYMDRPMKEWITKFYTEQWDNAARKNGEVEARVLRDRYLAHGIDPKKQNVRVNEMKHFLKHHSIAKDRPVLDIGCGYGMALKFLETLGFTKLYGLENSQHRAYIASSAYGFPTMAGAFEDPKIQEEYRKAGPFALIISHHVMEHVYDPGEVIRLAGDLQQEGDYLVMSLPDQKEEPSMLTILFFPHLHSFTKGSFAQLLERYGYEVIDDSMSKKKELFFLARKTEKERKITERSGDDIEWVKDRFANVLAFEPRRWFPRRRLWWYRPLGIDRGGQIPFFGNVMIDNALYGMRVRIDGFMHKEKAATQSCLVRDVSSRRISAKESRFEIQFEGNIFLAYK